MANALYPLVHTHSPTRQQANSRLPLQPSQMNAGYSSPGLPSQNGDASKPSPNNSRHLHLPQSSSFSNAQGREVRIMGRRKSAGLPTHLNLQGTGYGFVPSASRNPQMVDSSLARPSFGLRDAINVVLIPLPFCLASQLLQTTVSTISNEDRLRLQDAPAERLLQKTPLGYSSSVILVSGLTALIMAFMGVGAKLVHLQKTSATSARQPTSASLQQMNYYELGRVALLRCMVIGLPLFSLSCIGGVRVVVITLSTIAAGISGFVEREISLKVWKGLVQTRPWLLLVIALQIIADLAGISSDASSLKTLLGYITLLICILTLPMIYPTRGSRRSKLSLHLGPEHSTSRRHADSMSSQTSISPDKSPLISSPENVDLTLIIAGLLGLITLSFSLFTTSSAGAVFAENSLWIILTAFSFAISYAFADIWSMRKAKGSGSLVGSIITLASNVSAAPDIGQTHKFCMATFAIISYAATLLDLHISSASQSNNSAQSGNHTHYPDSSTLQISGASRITNIILPRIQKWPLLHTIIKDKDSRRIFYFMCLNFAFMIVQTFYGIVSGSLALLSDSIHMFFDCLALIVGLCAGVMSRWRPSTRFPYGYAKIETLAGFANGIFLMLISIEIIYEAIERLSEGTDVHRLNELMTVSIMGLIINVVGILAFGHAHHGHDHSHGHSHHHEHVQSHDHSHHHGHDHSHGHVHNNGPMPELTHQHKHGNQHHQNDHDHFSDLDRSHHSHDQNSHQQPHGHSSIEPHNDCHEHSHDEKEHHQNIESFPKLNGDFLGVPSPISSVYSSVPATPSKPAYAPHDHAQKTHLVEHAHGHKHSHDHHHHSENMMGIYLHVLGDTLGSLAVVISTWLVQWNGWSGWDPVASTAIAIIIFGTAIPLVKNCARKLLLTVPEDVEYDLREALAGLSGLRGVVGCTVPKFWIQDGEQRQIMGAVHVMAERSSNLEDVKERSLSFLNGAGLHVLVQVEREGVSRCWCQASR